ncbi:MAG: glycosyltransferase family 2 protein [Acidobacteria bacterium]|nr:glycosyltransferase family 2 protein [Acidobacteriota bacterium]MBI3655815.1 glycosyltransferase family 2 protein [Acidobacteriota bacterium]
MKTASGTDQAIAAYKPMVSIIIVNWNGGKYLEAAVSSALQQTYTPLEVLVVDNGSTDDSLSILNVKFGVRITVLSQTKNHGFSEGVNIGLRSARGQYIALLNNDAFADPNWISAMAHAMTYHPRVGMCACKVLFYYSPTVIDKVGHLMYPDGLNVGRGLGEQDNGQYDQTEEALFPDGSAALYRREVFEEAGLFDAQFFAYGDDADFGMRARWLGWDCRYVPTAVVHHVHSATFGRYSPQKAFLVERNRLWLAVKVFPARLLLASPYYTLVRFCWQAYAALSGRGSSGQFAQAHSRAALIRTLFRAYGSALRGLPAILQKRSAVFRARKVTSRDFIALLRRYRATARELALRER